jgi:hypothetical protein
MDINAKFITINPNHNLIILKKKHNLTKKKNLENPLQPNILAIKKRKEEDDERRKIYLAWRMKTSHLSLTYRMEGKR